MKVIFNLPIKVTDEDTKEILMEIKRRSNNLDKEFVSPYYDEIVKKVITENTKEYLNQKFIIK